MHLQQCFIERYQENREKEERGFFAALFLNDLLLKRVSSVDSGEGQIIILAVSSCFIQVIAGDMDL